MVKPYKEYVYTRETLAEVAETTANAISQHVRRKHIKIGSLRSVVLFLAEYGPEELRNAILKAVAYRPQQYQTGRQDTDADAANTKEQGGS